MGSQKENNVGIKDFSQQLPSADDAFRNINASKDFFKKKDRSRPFEMQDVSGVRTISWNSTGSALACGSENRIVSVGSLDPNCCRLKQIFTGYGHSDAVESIEFSKHDDMVMASCSNDRTVRVWDLRMPKSHTKLSTKDSNLFLSWSFCGKYIVYGDKSNTLGVIDSRMIKTVESTAFKDEINEFIVHPDGQTILVATDQGKLEILNFPKLKKIKTVQAHPILSSCLSMSLSPNERHLVIGASDACSSIWDLQDTICVQVLTRLDYPVRTVSFSHCGNIIASGSEDRNIDVSWLNGEKITEIPITTECYDVAWHPRLYLLAYASSSGGPDIRERDRDPVTLRIFGYSG